MGQNTCAKQVTKDLSVTGLEIGFVMGRVIGTTLRTHRTHHSNGDVAGSRVDLVARGTDVES